MNQKKYVTEVNKAMRNTKAMRRFDEFCIEKELREFHSYLTSESRANPVAFDLFVNYQKKLNELNLPRSKNQQPIVGLQQAQPQPDQPVPLQVAPQDQQPIVGLQQAQPQPDQPVPLQVAPQQGQQQNNNLPYGEPIDAGTGSKAASQAIEKLLPNIIKTAQQKNPGAVQQVQQAVNNFKQQWSQFKKQIPQLLGAQGVKNPQKHGLTYGLAPE